MNARRLVIGKLILAVFTCAFASVLSAADGPRGRVDYERADIPVDLPAAWPAEIDRLEPYPRQEFLSLMERLNSRSRGPRPAWLKSAHYEATLVNDTLKGGVMTASVQRLAERSALLDLGPFSFSLEELKWQNRPAVWGTSADGRTWVVADEGNRELLGEWSCRGRTFAGGIDFDLQLPAATTSFLDLRIPRTYTVFAPRAEVTQLSDIPSEPTRLWRIHCGSDSRCRMTLVEQAGHEASRRALLVEHDMQVVVREEDLRFQLNLFLEALDGPVQELVLRVPPHLEDYSAIYGIDTPIPIQRTAESDADGRIKIRLPGPLTGRRRTLRIDGIAVQKPGQPTIVPQIIVENSTFDGGHLSLTVQSPMQVRSLRSNGYRQRTTDAENLTFQQLTENAQLILDVHRKQTSLTGQMLCLLDVEEDSWNLKAEMTWNSLTGGGYQTHCQFPPEWEITDVRLIGSEAQKMTGFADDTPSRETSKLNWDVKVQEGVGSILAIEFLQAIQPGQPRTVEVIARRPPAPSGQSVPVPLPQLMNCDLTDVVLGVQTPSSATAELSPESRMDRIARPTSTQFSIPADQPSLERRWYRSDSFDGAGTLKLTPRLQPVHVKTETTVEALAAEYRVKYSIRWETRDSQTDRLLVYLTESGPDVRWTWKGSQTLELFAARLSKSQHVEWNLPSSGELWEIRFPRMIGEGLVIEGVSSNRWAATNHPALLFVPQAVEKVAGLKLNYPESIELNVDTDGLRSTGQRHSWWYATPQAELDLSLHTSEPSREFPLMVSMQLQTLISAETGGFDLYRARIQLENGADQESLRISLDPRAVIQEANIRDETLAASMQGGEFTIPGLSATRRDIVELIYRVPADANPLRDRRQIVVPKLSAQMLGFFWEFRIPPSARIYREPSGIRLARSIPSPSWSVRFFGPLGRSSGESLFQPFSFESWRQLFVPQPATTRSLGDFDDELASPDDWQVHQAMAPDVPPEITVDLWHVARLNLLSWISLGACLSIGLVLRLLGWTHRDRMAAYWLGLTIAAASSAPAPYAGILGGAIAGTLIALLIPRQILSPSGPGSRRSGTHRQRMPQIAIAGLCGGLTFLAASVAIPWNAAAQDQAIDEGTPSKRTRVFVPVDANGQPSESRRVVYVPPEALARWKAMASDLPNRPTYLISSARYQVSVVPDGNISLLAKYRVHVLDWEASSVTVLLPLAEVSLPDTESCRVNGLSHPVIALPGNKGYSVELTRPGDSKSDGNKSAGADRSDDEISTFDIELRTRKPRPSGSGFDLRLPAVANSECLLSFPDPMPFVDVAGGRGTVRQMDAKSLVATLGATAAIQLHWGQAAPPKKPTQIVASMLQHLELHPAYAELYFHAIGSIEEGGLDVLEFDIPQNAIVRRIQSRANDLLRSDVIVTKDGQRRLRVVFEKRQQSSLVIDGTFVLTQSDSLVQTSLPRFGLSASDSLSIQYDHNWWGVSTSSEFRLDTTNLDPENVSTISPDAYLNAWFEAADPRHPESMIPRQPYATFELRPGTQVLPAFTLIPHVPKRRATQWKQFGFIGPRRLEWTLIGEIETSQAPSFQTALTVDRRLRIEKISVMENDAERRSYWTESRSDPPRIVVFLSDKTQGKQTITVRGSMPLLAGSQVTLPSIRPDDCEIGESRLVLTRDPEVEVAFVPPKEWKILPSEESGRPNSATVGTYQLPDAGVRATIQTSSRHSRSACRAAALLKRVDDAGWKLKYRLEMVPQGASPLRMGLTFPATFTDLNAVTVEGAEPAWHEIHDGARQLDLLLDRRTDTNSVVVQFETTLAEPKLSDWELPLPIPLPASGHETLLVVESESVWFPKGGTEVRVADLPEWSAEFYDALPGSAMAFRIADPTVSIQREVVSTDLRDPAVRLLDQRVWLHGGGRGSGVTQAFLSSVRSDLQFDLPPHVHVTAVFLNDRPLALTAAADGRLTIPLTDAGTESILTMTWVVEGVDDNQQQAIKERFPTPREISVERNLVTILPESPTTLWCRSGLVPVSSIDQALDRLEAVLERHAALGAETRGAAANRWLIEQLQSRLVKRLPMEVEHPSQEVADRLQRWTRIVDAINLLEPVPTAPAISWYARLLEGPLAEQSDAIRGRGTDDAAVVCWRFDRRVVFATSSCLLALILIPLLRQLIRIEWSEWLHRHVAVSWLLLATFWWLFLTPSVLGPLLMIVALFRALSQHTPEQPGDDAVTVTIAK